ncbi:rhodanese-related sulfurtransferase [Candidatus Woesearchaeota archaeon]|nr:rhodanese-related sulfurtransferase [Candidatus Woesearchaeota archaeon]
MVPMSVILFYKYIPIENPEKLRIQQEALGKKLGLKGRVFLGREGINGTLSGTRDAITSYKIALQSNPLFQDIEFKEDAIQQHCFEKLFVRTRDEVVVSGLPIDATKDRKGKYLSPKEFKEMLDKKEHGGNNIIVVDARNSWESRIGRFKGAICPDIKHFRDFKKIIKELGNDKDKTILMYCTGGIRCEKASAFLLKNGFSNVYQLHGGIVTYCKEFPDTYWEGKCVVFDNRIAIEVNRENTAPITSCNICGGSCDRYVNCHNIQCDKLFVCCDDCGQRLRYSCSERCALAERRREKNVMVT